MKKLLLIIAVAVVMNGCCSQKRAERRVLRLAEQYPELVQMKAHPIDTFLGVPVFSDTAKLRLPVHVGDTFVESTPHGTFTAFIDDDDTTKLQVIFESNPTELHYQDTIHYSQVVVSPEAEAGGRGWRALLWFFLGVATIIAAFFVMVKLDMKN